MTGSVLSTSIVLSPRRARLGSLGQYFLSPKWNLDIALACAVYEGLNYQFGLISTVLPLLVGY